LRVLLAGPYPVPPRASTGGIETAVSLLSHGLAAIPGFDVHVATVAFDESGLNSPRDEGVRLHLLHSRQATSQLRRYRLQRQWLTRVADSIDPDIVHVHGTNFYGAASAKITSPSVLTVHGLLGREARLDFSDSGLGWRVYRRAKGVFNARFERETLAAARHVITISPYIERQLATPDRRLYGIPNPVADRFFSVPDRTQPARVLFVGAVHARKGLIPLAHALAALQHQIADLRLVIVGAVHSPDYRRALERAIHRLGIERLVEWRGHITDAELDEEYAKAAVLVLPSQEESAPFAVQQAMAAATPVVATRVGGVPHIVGHEETGLLVTYGDVPALAAALKRLLTDERLRRQLGDAGRVAARKRYDQRRVVEQTVDVYAAVIDQAHSRSNGRTAASSA
jgi:glycosyltransferase involved in cell wall biosynthesis